jgi:hypothetical protein
MNVYKKVNKNILSIVLEPRDIESSAEKLKEDFADAMKMREGRDLFIKLIDVKDLPSAFGVFFLRFLNYLHEENISISLQIEAELMDMFIELNFGNYLNSVQVNS